MAASDRAQATERGADDAAARAAWRSLTNVDHVIPILSRSNFRAVSCRILTDAAQQEEDYFAI